METHYKHTQVGRVPLVVLGVCLFAAAAALAYSLSVPGLDLSSRIGPLVAFIVFAILMAHFGTLTVTLYDEFLVVRFGPGPVRKKLALKDIESCQVVKNPWYYGWGIHRIRKGWLYNVSGLGAVELKTKNGREYRIGTDVPDELQRAISQSLTSMARHHKPADRRNL
jgi:hypothetical protein